MRKQEIKFKNKIYSYSILIGKNTIAFLPEKIKKLCPKTKNIALIIDNKVPNKFKVKLKQKLKNFNVIILPFAASEKNKSMKTINHFLKNCY